ncbi:PepSY domain-containing protein [Shewanella sp. YIC-542]|uniref:PepSY domain-containing protein n=1 Tax=Shewanella mytili TaxID=3377111 RepID=UPI00398F154B
MSRLIPLCWVALFPITAQANIANVPLQADHDIAKELVKTGEILSLDTTLSNLQHFCYGQLVDAHLYQKDGEWRYDLLLRTEEDTLLRLDLNAGTSQHDSQPLPEECRPYETTSR